MEHIDRVRAKAAVITDTTTKWVLPEDASIHTAEVTEIKITLKEIHKKRKQKMGNIYNLSELYKVHRIQQRKSPVVNLDI